jgi:hypothetical protein
MKTNLVDHAETKFVSAERGTKTKMRWPLFVLVLISAAFGAGGCADYYGGYYGAGYGPGPYYGGGPYGRGYAGYGPYGAGYAGSPGYVAAPGSVTVAVGDRPYYTRGPGYWSGNVYYVWKPGHWAVRHGQRVWIRGHYVVRG